MLYLDNCATTEPLEDVVRAIADVMRKTYGNPSSIHRAGVEAERLLTKSREVIAGALRCKPSEIVFTSCGTESNNLAVKGAALQYRKRGNHIVTSAIEHASVYEACLQLQTLGYEVTFLQPDETGYVSPEKVRAAIRDDTILVSLMQVNNEVGTIQPVAEVGKLLRDYPRILFHVDAVQSIGKLPLAPSEMGIDLMSISAHKLRGPKGAGILYRREGIELMPLLSGGGQEQGMRSGTENVPLIVGMAKAVRIAVEGREAAAEKLYQLRGVWIERLGQIPGVVLNGAVDPKKMAPQLVHFSCPGVKSEVIVHALEQHGVYISTRSACASGETEPSRVLLAMGQAASRASSGLRISFLPDQSIDDMNKAADCLTEVIARLRAMTT